MQQPKPRKEAFSGCGDAADLARAPTIHKRGLVVFTARAAGRGEIRGGAWFSQVRGGGVRRDRGDAAGSV
jgi:hypothetical protein